MNGWIKLHRKLLQRAEWTSTTPKQTKIMLTLLLMVSHDESEWLWKGEKYIVKPGQMITSLNSIKENCGKNISIRNIRTCLSGLEKLQFLTNEPTNTGRLITICKWDIYQSMPSKTDKATDKQLTSNCQATDTYQECKNERKRRYIYS